MLWPKVWAKNESKRELNTKSYPTVKLDNSNRRSGQQMKCRHQDDKDTITTYWKLLECVLTCTWRVLWICCWPAFSLAVLSACFWFVLGLCSICVWLGLCLLVVCPWFDFCLLFLCLWLVSGFILYCNWLAFGLGCVFLLTCFWLAFGIYLMCAKYAFGFLMPRCIIFGWCLTCFLTTFDYVACFWFASGR